MRTEIELDGHTELMLSFGAKDWENNRISLFITVLTNLIKNHFIHTAFISKTVR